MKVLKVLVGILLVIFLVIAGTIFLAQRYLTEERVKALVIPPLEEATGLKVQIEGVKRSGLFGVKVTGVSFLDPREGQKVLSADELRLSLSFWPLIRGELNVTELVFVRPRVVLVREKDGRLNLERYFLKEEKAKGPAEAKGPPKLALVFQNLRVEGAQILFRDELKKLPPAEALLSLAAKLSLSQGQLSVDGQGSLDAQVAGGPLVSGLKFRLFSGSGIKVSLLGGKFLGGDLKGEVNIREERLLGLLKLEKADFKETGELAQRLKPYFFPEAELPKLAGSFDLEADLSGSTKVPEIRAVFRPHPLQVVYAPYRLEITGEGTLQKMVLTPNFLVSINGEKLRLSGQVDLRPKVPQVNLLVEGKKFDLKPLLVEENQAPSSEGSSSPSKGQEKAPLIVPVTGKVRLRLEELCYHLCAKEVKSEVYLKPQEIDLKDLSFLLGGAATQVTGKVSGLSHRPLGKLSYSVAGLDLPLVLEAFVPESNYFTSGKVWSEGRFTFRGIESETIKKTLNGLGQAKFLNLGLKPSPLTNALATLLHFDELQKLHFQEGQGKFEVKNGLVHLRGRFQREGLGLLLEGTIGLDGRLNLNPEILFQGEMARLFARRFPGASLFKTEKGYVVPFTVRGTVDKPKLALVQIEKKIKEKAVEKLFQFLGPKN